MRSRRRVLYIAGIGGLPKVQEELTELWEPFGLLVEYQSVDWTATDYERTLARIGERIVDLSKSERISLVGASGGGKTILSLFARLPETIHRVVTISSKVGPYELGAGTRAAYPNLVTSSDILPDDLKKINARMLKRVLCVHPPRDEIVAPEDAVLPGASELIVDASDHVAGIERALTVNRGDIANFIHKD